MKPAARHTLQGLALASTFLGGPALFVAAMLAAALWAWVRGGGA